MGPLEAALQPALAEDRWRVPERFNFTRDVVEVLADESRRRQALMFLGPDGVLEPRTFHQLAEGASRWAAHLRENGVRPGDRVLVVVGTSPRWIEVMLAGMKVGAVTVPCSPMLPAAALDVRVTSTGAKVVVAERAAHVEHFAAEDKQPTVLYVDDGQALPERRLGEEPTHDNASKDTAFILSTSGGATGPHGVEHTHAAAFASRAQAEHWLDARPGDVVWCTTDTASAVTVWNLLLGPWSRGAEIVLHDGAFDAEERLDLIRRFDVTVLCQTPAEYRALAETGERMLQRYQPDRLRRMVSTGDFLSSDVVTVFEEAWGMPVEDGYSQAQCGVIIGHGADLGVESGSVGHPLPGFDVLVVDENGHELPPGAEGQLALRGRPPSLFARYWNAPDETKLAFRGDLYLTGDVVVRNDDKIWFLGRTGDVITSGGLRFSPFEVEKELVGYRAIAEAGVVGIRDLQRGGQYVRAFVVLQPDVEGSDRLVAEIRQHLRHTLPEDKVPREIEFVDALPMTPDGKILRHELRERLTVGTEPVWTKAPRLPGTPAPVTTFEAAPEPQGDVAPDEGPLPDFVVPSSETYATVANDGAVGPALELEPEDQELPDYVVLPDHVVSFLQAEPLAGLDVPPAPGPEPAPRPKPRVRPIAEPEPQPEPEPVAAVEPEPEPEPEPKPKPAAAAVPEPASRPKPRVRPIAQPEVIPETKPEAGPEAGPETVETVPEPVVAAEAAPVPPAEPPAAPAKPKAAPEPVVAQATPKPPAAPKPKPRAVPRPTSAPQPAAGKSVAARPARPATPPASRPPSQPAAPPAPPAKSRPAPAAASAPAPPAARPARKPAPPPASPPAPAPAAEPKRQAASAPENGVTKPSRKKRRGKRVEPAAPVQKPAVQRSAPEPGEEDPDLAWMRGISSRLDAYSIATEDAEPTHATDERGDPSSD